MGKWARPKKFEGCREGVRGGGKYYRGFSEKKRKSYTVRRAREKKSGGSGWR